MHEKRSASRRMFHVPLTLLLASGQIFQARSYDLALGGLAALSALQLEAGMDCTVDFDLPATAKQAAVRLHLAARIIYSQPGASGYKHGLQFTRLDTHEQQLLTAFLSTLNH